MVCMAWYVSHNQRVYDMVPLKQPRICYPSNHTIFKFVMLVYQAHGFWFFLVNLWYQNLSKMVIFCWWCSFHLWPTIRRDETTPVGWLWQTKSDETTPVAWGWSQLINGAFMLDYDHPHKIPFSIFSNQTWQWKIPYGSLVIDYFPKYHLVI